MPRCDCGAYITSGSECQTCRLEHQHGTLEDRRDTCTVCGGTIGRDAPTKTVDGGTAHAECQGQLRCDGGPNLHQWVLHQISEQVSDEADVPQDNSLWTSKARLKAEASKVDFVERDEILGVVDQLEARGDVVYWHGLIAPATDDHLSEIISSEVQGNFPREILIGRLNRAKSENAVTAAGGDA